MARSRAQPLIVMLALVSTPASAEWVTLCPGMEYACFDACSRSIRDDSRITVVRVDTHVVTLQLLAVSDLGITTPMRAEDWAERYNLALVINAGMFGADWRTHLGYLKVSDTHTNSRNVRQTYKSVLAFGPQKGGLAPAVLRDLETESIGNLSNQYETVVQNLRMIRSPGRVVWARSQRKWSEAALGMDASGRLLFIFCRSPYSMHEFSACLLGLPLNLVAAQHLEGGGDATMVIRTSKLSATLVGSYETGANDGSSRPYENIRRGFPLPNVLAVISRDGCASTRGPADQR